MLFQLLAHSTKSIFHEHHLQSQQDAEILICGILTLTVLLPSMPTLVKPYLPEMFEIFIRLTSWRIKKPGMPIEIDMN